MKMIAPAIRGAVIVGLMAPGSAMAADPPASPAQPAAEPAQPTPSDNASSPIDEVIVNATRHGTRGPAVTQVGPFIKVPLQDAPYSIGITNGALIENRGAHTLSDALLTNPAVVPLQEPNSFSGQSLVMIRGFAADGSGDLRDGLVYRSFTQVPLENIARVEVLNGLSSFLYGFGAVGGTINYVSKQPSAAPRADLTVGDYGGGINYGQIGVTGPLDRNKQLIGRLDLYREDGDTNIDHGTQNRTVGAMVLNYRIAPDTLIKLDYLHQDFSVAGLATYFAPLYIKGIAQIPAAIDPTRQYGQPYTHNESQVDLGGAGIETRLADHLVLRVAYRYGQMSRRYDYVDAHFTSLPGVYREFYVDTPEQFQTTHAGYALGDWDFTTGSVRHTLTFGYTGSAYDFRRGLNRRGGIGLSTVDDPVYYAPPFHVAQNAAKTTQGQEMDNFLVGDRIVFDPEWSMLIGVNYARLLQGATGRYAGISLANFSQSLPSPGASVVYKPLPELSLYATYMQGLAEGQTAPDNFIVGNITKPVKNAGEILAPGASDQYEVGAKGLWGRMFLTGALFYIDKVSDETDASDLVYKADGSEVHEGFEFTATGKLTDRLTAIGGFTIMRARIENASRASQLNGKIPINVPEEQGRAYLEYQIPWTGGLIGSIGANYFGSRPVDNLNTAFLPAATTFDLGARYRTSLFGQDTTLNVHVSNLFDKSYWSYFRYGDGMLLAAPRAVSAFAKMSF
jgi:iron complex outermembrane receptor protein